MKNKLNLLGYTIDKLTNLFRNFSNYNIIKITDKLQTFKHVVR